MLAALLLAAAWNLQAASTPPPPITAVGCVAQTPDNAAAPPTGHEQAAAKGLTLTRATTRADQRTGRSAVPGSQPSGTGSGTTDGNTPRVARVEQSFWLVGAKAAEMLRFLGRRVEVTGTIDEKLAANPGGVTDAGGSAARRAATAPPEPPATAHPSAPTRAISVTTFRVLDEACS